MSAAMSCPTAGPRQSVPHGRSSISLAPGLQICNTEEAIRRDILPQGSSTVAQEPLAPLLYPELNDTIMKHQALLGGLIEHSNMTRRNLRLCRQYLLHAA